MDKEMVMGSGHDLKKYFEEDFIGNQLDEV